MRHVKMATSLRSPAPKAPLSPPAAAVPLGHAAGSRMRGADSLAQALDLLANHRGISHDRRLGHHARMMMLHSKVFRVGQGPERSPDLSRDDLLCPRDEIPCCVHVAACCPSSAAAHFRAASRRRRLGGGRRWQTSCLRARRQRAQATPMSCRPISRQLTWMEPARGCTSRLMAAR